MLQSKRGFSLIELMIVLGISTTVTLGMTKFLGSQSKMNAKMRDSLETNQIFSTMRTVLLIKENCTESFNGVSLDEGLTEDFVVTNTAKNLKFKSGDKIQTVTLSSMKLENIDTPEDGDGFVKLAMDFTLSKAAGKQTKQHEIMLRVNTSDNKINHCFNDHDLIITNMCQSLGGSLTNGKCQNIDGSLLSKKSIKSDSIDLNEISTALAKKIVDDMAKGFNY